MFYFQTILFFVIISTLKADVDAETGTYEGADTDANADPNKERSMKHSNTPMDGLTKIFFSVEVFAPAVTECREQIGVDFDSIKEFVFNRVIKNNGKMKLFLFCLGQALGVQSRSGQVNPMKLSALVQFLGLVPEEYMSDALNRCTYNHYSGVENAYRTMSCLISYSSNLENGQQYPNYPSNYYDNEPQYYNMHPQPGMQLPPGMELPPGMPLPPGINSRPSMNSRPGIHSRPGMHQGEVSAALEKLVEGVKGVYSYIG